MSTLHIVFGDSAAAVLQPALAWLGRVEAVAVCRDDLSYGPIDPADPAKRAAWIAQELSCPEWGQLVPDLESFWAKVMGDWDRRVIWLSRRVASEYAGFLETLWRLGDAPCEIVDLTEATISRRTREGKIVSRPALCLAMLDAEDVVDSDLPRLAAPLAAETRVRYRAEWQKLCEENAPLRIVTPELVLTSAPMTHFDAALMSAMQPHFLKTARIIGQVLGESCDTDVFNAGDFFLALRLRALAASGAIESQGDLTRIGFSEVRLPERA